MTSLTFQQKACLGIGRDVCQPIDWEAILERPEKPFTPKTVRQYLQNVVERMNKHFAIYMHGKNLCKIRVTRSATNSNLPVEVNVSSWQARQLFPKKIFCQWFEHGKQKSLFKNVIDLFLLATNRKEIYAFGNEPIEQSSLVVWLKKQLSLPEECCQIKFGGLNSRKMLYDSFLEDKRHPEDWSPKAISLEFYKLLPACRPATGQRVRRKGIAMMYVPCREYCQKVLESLIQQKLAF